MSFRGKVPDVLPFTKADLRLPLAIRKGQRNSISGVQAKVLLSILSGRSYVHGLVAVQGFGIHDAGV